MQRRDFLRRAAAIAGTGALAGAQVIMAAAGLGHSMALTIAGQVYAWGQNSRGQLGDGGTATSKEPKEVSISGAGAIAAVGAAAAGFASGGIVRGLENLPLSPEPADCPPRFPNICYLLQYS